MGLLEKATIWLGRHVHARGSGRILRTVYPADHAAKRFVRGVHDRGDGLLMDLDSRNWIDWNLLFRGDYEAHIARLWSRLTREGGVAIDIGANIGVHTLSLARCVGATGRVLAFEPNPLVRTALLRNVALNGMTQVSVYDCALGTERGTLPLRVPKKDSAEFSHMGLASLVALDTPHDLVDVDIRPLDEVLEPLALNGVDVVKIDVQGYEVAALRGMRGCLDRFRPVVILEYDAWAWERAQVALPDAFDLFWAAGYDVFRLDDYSRPGAEPLSRESSYPDFLDVIAIPRGDARGYARAAS